MLLDLIRTNNRTVSGILLEHFKCFFIVFMQFIYSRIVSIPTVHVHSFWILVDLILDEIQMSSLKRIINACFVLGDQLPVCDRIWNFKAHFWIAFSFIFRRP